MLEAFECYLTKHLECNCAVLIITLDLFKRLNQPIRPPLRLTSSIIVPDFIASGSPRVLDANPTNQEHWYFSVACYFKNDKERDEEIAAQADGALSELPTS